jgi:anti-repressor protein
VDECFCGVTTRAEDIIYDQKFSGEPRDHMNAEQLEHLSYLESTNITLIDMGMEYEQRKGELTRLSQRWLAKRLEVVNV